jgi:predicted nucleic acid-binding protein
LTLPAGGVVCIDANVLIYSVERIPDYAPLLLPLWAASKAKTIRVVSSELLVLEALVGPMKKNDAVLLDAYERVFRAGEVELIPVSLQILRDAAELRARHSLKTPDAIHAASALARRCTLYLTNDAGFRRIPGLAVGILAEILQAAGPSATP